MWMLHEKAQLTFAVMKRREIEAKKKTETAKFSVLKEQCGYEAM